jgi:hypothetical protein
MREATVRCAGLVAGRHACVRIRQDGLRTLAWRRHQHHALVDDGHGSHSDLRAMVRLGTSGWTGRERTPLRAGAPTCADDAADDAGWRGRGVEVTISGRT